MSENNKRGRLYIYGERGVSVSVMVPESKKEEVLVKLYAVLKEYENPATLVLEPLSRENSRNATILSENNPVEISKSSDEGFEASTFILDDVSGFRDAQIKYDLPKHSGKGFLPKVCVEVKSLPNTKKKIGVGLYSADGKFYTNKIVDNKLVILEWSDQEAAEGYLDNLK